MAKASISQYLSAVPDQVTERNLYALLQSILLDLTALRAAHNTHAHPGVTEGTDTSGATTGDGVMGELNTVA